MPAKPDSRFLRVTYAEMQSVAVLPENVEFLRPVTFQEEDGVPAVDLLFVAAVDVTGREFHFTLAYNSRDEDVWNA